MASGVRARPRWIFRLRPRWWRWRTASFRQCTDRRGPRFALAAEGGLVVRGAPDAAMRGRLRAGRIEGIGARMELGVIPSYGDRLQVVGHVAHGRSGLEHRTRRALSALARCHGRGGHSPVVDGSELVGGGELGVCAAGRSVDEAPRRNAATPVRCTLVCPAWELGTSVARWRIGNGRAGALGLAFGFSYGWRIE